MYPFEMHDKKSKSLRKSGYMQFLLIVDILTSIVHIIFYFFCYHCSHSDYVYSRIPLKSVLGEGKGVRCGAYAASQISVLKRLDKIESPIFCHHVCS